MLSVFLGSATFAAKDRAVCQLESRTFLLVLLLLLAMADEQ